MIDFISILYWGSFIILCDIYYSVLNATTGSFLAADLAGIKPEIVVNRILIKIIIIAWYHGKAAIV